MMAPMNWARPEVRGLAFAAPFGIAILAITPVFALIYFAFIKKGLPKRADWKISWWRGMLSGAGWNIGNVARYAESSPLITTLAFPIF